jgi:hypothetical protein
VSTSEDFFESQYYINTLGDVDLVCLASDRKVSIAPVNMVMSLQVLQETGKYVPNGATITGTFGGDSLIVAAK